MDTDKITDDEDTIVIRPPRGTKGRWVHLSQKKSQKLTDFVVHHVERSIALDAPESLEPGAIRFTRRQRQLIVMLDRGLGNQEIARELALSEQTIKVHLYRLYKRFGINSRTQLLHLARKNGAL